MNQTKASRVPVRKEVKEVASLLQNAVKARLTAKEAEYEVTNRVDYVLDLEGCDPAVEDALNELVEYVEDQQTPRTTRFDVASRVDYTKAARELFRLCKDN
jgi:hypothetical protein